MYGSVPEYREGRLISHYYFFNTHDNLMEFMLLLLPLCPRGGN